MSSQDQSLLAEDYSDAAVLVLDISGFTERCMPIDTGKHHRIQFGTRVANPLPLAD